MLTFDSNVLVYAVDSHEPVRKLVAQDLLLRATRLSAFITQQAVGEFCNVVSRKLRLPARDLRPPIDAWSKVFPIVPTSVEQLLAAADLAETRRKQFWDMVIVRVAADAGATVLFSEDIGDGEVIAGVRIVDPFGPANAAAVDALLIPAS